MTIFMSKYIKIMLAYLLIAFFAVQFLGLRESYAKAKIKAINELPPNAFNDLVTSLRVGTKLDPERIDAYLNYAQTVLRLNPQNAEVWGLSGLCFALKEDYQRAIFSYIKASSLEPGFFGFHYDLAFLYYKTKQYELALSQVESALKTDPKRSINYILASDKVYGAMMLARMGEGIMPQDQINNAYAKADQLLAAVQYRLDTGLSFPGEDSLALEFESDEK